MNGVVLWTDQNRALIWCEDQGPLAFCDLGSLRTGPGVASGDLVLFETEMRDGLRVAKGLTCLERNAAPGLAAVLEQMQAQPVPQAEDEAGNGAKILPFDRGQKKTGAQRRAGTPSRRHASV